MPTKRLVDILDDMNLKENEVLNKLGRLLRLISSTNPSMDDPDLRWVERQIEKFDEGMWELIDGLLTQENRSKIGAIKILRRFTECNLRDAKEAVDAREHSIKNGWTK